MKETLKLKKMEHLSDKQEEIIHTCMFAYILSQLARWRKIHILWRI